MADTMDSVADKYTSWNKQLQLWQNNRNISLISHTAKRLLEVNLKGFHTATTWIGFEIAD